MTVSEFDSYFYFLDNPVGWAFVFLMFVLFVVISWIGSKGEE